MVEHKYARRKNYNIQWYTSELQGKNILHKYRINCRDNEDCPTDSIFSYLFHLQLIHLTQIQHNITEGPTTTPSISYNGCKLDS